MKDRSGKAVKRGRAKVRRRNPMARALVERAMGTRAIPTRKRFSRKAKHPRPIDPADV
jgi:hypothetical protein